MARPKLLERYRERLRVKHYSLRTEEAYLHWVRRFICFHGKRHPREMGGAEVEAFLSHLATEGRVAPSTQNQALAALLFLYREVLQKELPWMEGMVRAKRTARVPVVLTESEVLAQLDGTRWLASTAFRETVKITVRSRSSTRANGPTCRRSTTSKSPPENKKGRRSAPSRNTVFVVQTMSRCSMPLLRSLSFASLPCSLMFRRTSLVESAKRSASS